MATFQVSPPEKFVFSQPENWTRWLQRFNRFRFASGLDDKDEEAQVNCLLYSMGPEADDIFNSLNLTEENRKKYKNVTDELNNYFIVRRNVIYERAKFNLRVQNDGEPVDSYITALHTLSEHCKYGALREEMIRDRIVVGIRNSHLSEKLQLDAELTLKKATDTVRQSEAVRRQQADLKPEFSKDVDAIKKRTKNDTRENRGPKFVPKPKSKCGRCGKSPDHLRDKCPARDGTCRNCKKKGHWAPVCRSKPVHEINEERSSGHYLGEIESEYSEPWWSHLSVNGVRVKFKIDCGADVTVIPESVYKRLKSPKLSKANRNLFGPCRSQLKVIGCFIAVLETSRNMCEHTVYVVRGLSQSLLGRPALERLKLVTRADNVESESTNECYKATYPNVFSGLGQTDWEYKITLKEDAKPFALSTPRRVALPLMDKVKAELKRIEDLNVISKVDTPTDWCSGMVVVPKPSGDVRICVDLTKLNESVRRENYPLPDINQSLGKLSGATVFSKLDANSGFYQINLAEESKLLTTFITPFGRYYFNRLPFGISAAPEFFQKRMSQLLECTEGTLCHMDDILVFGSNKEEHDLRLKRVMDIISKAGITLNDEKCEFKKKSVKFLGHVIDENGIRADPDKIKAITELEAPVNVSEVRRFLGMINQLSKFSENLADKTKPIRELLEKRNQWYWGDAQQKAFDDIKKGLTSIPVLAHYDPQKETVVSADASSYGIGSVLKQKQDDGSFRAISYASRSLTDTESRYAIIEKETLACTWSCEKFKDYLIGKEFVIETDHKPLISLLGYKTLDELPPRIMRFRMRLMRFNYSMSFVRGVDQNTADTLSRSPMKEKSESDITQEVECFISFIVKSLPASESRLQEIRDSLINDPVSCALMSYVREGWPEKHNLTEATKPYWSVRDDFSIHDGLLLKGSRLYIPVSMRSEILQKIHEGHLGITKCRERAKESVFWIGLSKQIEDLVNNCRICAKYRNDQVEPLLTTEMPNRPWQTVGTDLFEFKGAQYLLVVDYFSRYVELARLTSTTSAVIVNHLQSIFSRHGIPDTLRSDNGPQYASETFKSFAKSYGFSHVTSSPRYSQSNGEAERAVQTVKNLIRKSDDPYIALMTYRATPLNNGYSPAELLMGRKIRTKLPVLPSQLTPNWDYLAKVKKTEKKYKEKQETYYNNRHNVKAKETLKPGQEVWIKDQQLEGKIDKQSDTPRSYIVETPKGQLRRSSRHLVSMPKTREDNDLNTHLESAKVQSSTNQSDITPKGLVTTRSGREVKPPTKFGFDD